MAGCVLAEGGGSVLTMHWTWIEIVSSFLMVHARRRSRSNR